MSAPRLYIILANGSSEKLAAEVNSFLEKDRWECVGGVSHSLVAYTSRDDGIEFIETWSQAMIKYVSPV